MSEILKIVQNQNTRSSRSSDDGYGGPESLFLNHDHKFSDATSDVPFGFQSAAFITSPFSSMGSLMKPENYPAPIERLLAPQMVFIEQNIITMGLVTRIKAIELLEV